MSARRLFKNEKSVSEREFLQSCRDENAHILVVADGEHVFDSLDGYDAFIAGTPDLKDRHSEFTQRVQFLQKAKDRDAGTVERLAATLASLHVAEDGIVNAIAGLMSTRDDEAFRSFVSPKAGTVEFYRDLNYGGRFARTEGYLHIARPTLGSNNDKLSSIKVMALAVVSLFQHSWFRGRRLSFGSLPIQQDCPDLNRFDFNDRTSSWAFWV